MLLQTMTLSSNNSESAGRLTGSFSSATAHHLCLCEQSEGFSATDQLRAFLLDLSRSRYSEAYETMLASEDVLRRDWDTPEEDEAWSNL
jgi:hypothetical protein